MSDDDDDGFKKVYFSWYVRLTLPLFPLLAAQFPSRAQRLLRGQRAGKAIDAKTVQLVRLFFVVFYLDSCS